MTHFWPGAEDSPPPWMSSLTRPAFIRVSEEHWAEWAAWAADLERIAAGRDGEAVDGTA